MFAPTHVMAESSVQSQPTPPFPPQKQPKPGLEAHLNPRPRYQATSYKPAGKLAGKRALITGGDSGIGRAVAVLFAREGADVAITALPAEHVDSEETRLAVEDEGRRCVVIEGDLSDEVFCRQTVARAIDELGGLDILVSNAAYQNRKSSIEEVTDEEWDVTFKTNLYAYFRLVKAVPANSRRARRRHGARLKAPVGSIIPVGPPPERSGRRRHGHPRATAVRRSRRRCRRELSPRSTGRPRTAIRA